MAKNNVKVLGAWPSPFVMRPRIALNIKSVEYEFLPENLGEKSDLLLKSNPIHKKIPVLIHDGKPVCESLIIVEYIDEAWPVGPSILPSDPLDRATARFWASYIDEKWFPNMKGLVGAKGEEAKKALLEKVSEGLVSLEGAFQSSSKGNALFGGDHIGLVDIALGSYLGWLRVTEMFNGVELLEQDKTPGLIKWAHTFSAHESVNTVMPETHKLADFAINVLMLNNPMGPN